MWLSNGLIQVGNDTTPMFPIFNQSIFQMLLFLLTHQLISFYLLCSLITIFVIFSMNILKLPKRKGSRGSLNRILSTPALELKKKRNKNEEEENRILEPIRPKVKIEMRIRYDSFEDDYDENGEFMYPSETSLKAGIGEFGLDPTNPIPVFWNGGISRYLNSLHKRKFSLSMPRTFQSLEKKQISVRNLPLPVHEYSLLDGNKTISMYFYPHHEYTTLKAPKGYWIKSKLPHGFKKTMRKDTWLSTFTFLTLIHLLVSLVCYIYYSEVTFWNCISISIFNSVWMLFTIVPFFTSQRFRWLFFQN